MPVFGEIVINCSPSSLRKVPGRSTKVAKSRSVFFPVSEWSELILFQVSELAKELVFLLAFRDFAGFVSPVLALEFGSLRLIGGVGEAAIFGEVSVVPRGVKVGGVMFWLLVWATSGRFPRFRDKTKNPPSVNNKIAVTAKARRGAFQNADRLCQIVGGVLVTIGDGFSARKPS